METNAPAVCCENNADISLRPGAGSWTVFAGLCKEHGESHVLASGTKTTVSSSSHAEALGVR